MPPRNENYANNNRESLVYLSYDTNVWTTILNPLPCPSHRTNRLTEMRRKINAKYRVQSVVDIGQIYFAKTHTGNYWNVNSNNGLDVG